MTLSRRSVAASLQVVGLLGSGLAVVASYVSRDSCMGPIYLMGAVIAVGLDLVAMWVAPASAGIGVAIGKLALVTFATMGIVVSCAAPPPAYVEPPIPSGTAALVLLWSSVPSVLGAIGRRSTR